MFGEKKMELTGSTILITGGTGSFGNRVATHLLRQVNQSPAEIRIYSRDEKKQWEMHNLYPQFRYIIGDVRDTERLKEVMQGVDYVFHAAALKQVPSCENYPYEAFKTNVIGSQNVCEAAKANKVKTVVALSTDKAVKPVNAMGMSKAMMEKIVCSYNQFGGTTTFCSVRYGNVMGSRGSVIPLFHKQIMEDRPLTVTIPHMTRFLMTLDQSVDLVLHAMINAQGGEVFVRKAQACTVQALAETMRLKFSPRGERHPINVVGVRPGEKVHEVLVNEYEMHRVKENEHYFEILPEYRPMKLAKPAFEGEEYTSANTSQLKDPKEIGKLLDLMGKEEEFV